MGYSQNMGSIAAGVGAAGTAINTYTPAVYVPAKSAIDYNAIIGTLATAYAQQLGQKLGQSVQPTIATASTALPAATEAVAQVPGYMYIAGRYVKSEYVYAGAAGAILLLLLATTKKR